MNSSVRLSWGRASADVNYQHAGPAAATRRTMGWRQTYGGVMEMTRGVIDRQGDGQQVAPLGGEEINAQLQTGTGGTHSNIHILFPW